MEARRPEARYNPGMTRKQFSALAFCAICALAPLNAARAGEAEKSPAPPGPTPKSNAEKPADPKIAALVKEMEDPLSSEKRAKAFDALLALGEGGVEAIRESLSCRGAKIVIESTVTPQSAPPNTPIKVEFRMKNAGTGTVWIMAVRKDPYLLRLRDLGRFESMGCTRPRNDAPQEFVGIDFTRKDLPDPHPMTFWRPVMPGESVARVETNTKIPRVGRMEVSCESAIDVPRRLWLPGFELKSGSKEPTLNIVSALKDEDVQGRETANAFALPDLEHLPGEGPVTLEVSAKVEDLPGEAAAFPCSVTLRNTKPDSPLLLEDSMCAFAWVALLDERGLPTGHWSFDDCLPGTAKEKFALKPRVLREPVSLTLQIPRPGKPGTYRILAGYEVTPGGTRPGDDWAPTFTSLQKAIESYGRITQARAFALSKAFRIQEAAPNADAAQPKDGKPATPAP